MSAGRTALIVFVRPPVRGRVKTRLARTLGDDVALAFYRACTEHVLGELRALAASTPDLVPYLFVADADELEAVRRLHGGPFIYRVQRGASLGERMYHAFAEVLAAGAAQAIIVPSDAPDLSAALVGEAVAALRDHDAVFGPAADGGYYLLGLKAAHGALFVDMPWSTAAVGAITRERLARLGLRVAELACLPDIDEEADLRAWLGSPATRDHPLRPRLEGLLGLW